MFVIPTTRDQIADLYSHGISLSEIARRLDRSKATISYHLRRLGHGPNAKFGRRYDWAAIRDYYDAGHSFRECRARFGFNAATWFEAVRRGAIEPRPSTMPIDALLAVRRDRKHLKQRLVREGLKRLVCEVCGLDSWCDRPLSLELHNVNGSKDDNPLLISGSSCRQRLGSGGERRRHVVDDDALKLDQGVCSASAEMRRPTEPSVTR